MKPDQNPDPQLHDGMSRAGSLHGVQELEGKGIREIRVLSASGLQELLEVAVNRTLRKSLQGIELSDEAREAIATRAIAEYEQLVKSGLEAPPGSPGLDRGQDDLSLRDFLNQEVKNVRGLVDGAPDPSPLSYDISPRSDEFKVFEERMVHNISALLEKDWRSEIDKVESSHRHQLSLLEKRISKLVRALESTDRVIEHVRRGRETDEDAPVDGDAVAAPTALTEKKSQLLSALFQANLKLKELQNGGS